jgi:tetratricopeptide (TPR) repeat protein
VEAGRRPRSGAGRGVQGARHGGEGAGQGPEGGRRPLREGRRRRSVGPDHRDGPRPRGLGAPREGGARGPPGRGRAGRSDFVALLARAQSVLGDHAATAKLLDEVRITIWEGAREVHDLFEEAHLALGSAHLEAGRAAEALAEFDRALEYPENLATGRLEGVREAHIHYLRGKALAALGRTADAAAAYRKAAEEKPSGDARKEEARRKAGEELSSLPAAAQKPARKF